MRKILFTFFLSLFVCEAFSQMTDSFNDGDFTNNPAWVAGSDGDWIVNGNQQLQSNNTIASSTFYISTGSSLSMMTEWEFWTRLNFNTSSANFVDVFLTASGSNVSLTTVTGYFVRIGSAQDDISLYRKDGNGTITRIIDGVDGVTDKSDNVLKIKVVRNASGQFTLFRDDSGTGNNYVSEGSGTDVTYTTSSFFGFLVRQSTSSFFQRHFFDDIVIRTYVPDVTPPAIQSVTATSPTTLEVLFTEPVGIASSQLTANYNINGIGQPLSAVRSAANNALVTLTFATAFTNAVNYTLSVSGVQDIAGNAMSTSTASFSFYIPQQYDVVIDEIMADPTPQVTLPNAEFIELKNVSGRTINLGGWRLTTGTSTTGAFPSYNLPADSFLIITATSQVATFSQYGRVLGVPGFPALPNDGSLLSLISKEGKTIHAINYNISWYQNSIKADGGWTLEMVDSKNPCGGITNWRASTDPSGGTPGRKNSVDGQNQDQTPPQLIRTYSLDNQTVVAVFDESLDSTSASIIGNYSFTNNLTVVSASAQSPLFNSVILRLSSPMQLKTIYTLTVANVRDCKGNTIGAFNKAKAGLAEEALPNDLIINEILFNPKPNAFDYVELYNRSNKILDASKIFIANRNSVGDISSFRLLSSTPYFIYPEDHIVVTENPVSLAIEFFAQNPSLVLQLALPSYPDDKGIVVITNTQGDVVDEVGYQQQWHFNLVSNREGVALERMDPNASSQDPNNWTSAASTVGFGTPTYKNSQLKQVGLANSVIEITPKVFSPDNDGFEDITTISYQVDAPGYIANITIFDAAGRLVRNFVRNGLLSTSGRWNWDGLGENGQKLPIGTYVIFTEIFNLQGKRQQFKNTVVLARRLN